MKNKIKRIIKSIILVATMITTAYTPLSFGQVVTTTPNNTSTTTQSLMGGIVTTTMPNYGYYNNNNINSNKTQDRIANTLQNKEDTMKSPIYTSSVNKIDPSVLTLADKFNGDLYVKYSLENYEKSLHNPGNFYNTYSIDYYTNYRQAKKH